MDRNRLFGLLAALAAAPVFAMATMGVGTFVLPLVAIAGVVLLLARRYGRSRHSEVSWAGSAVALDQRLVTPRAQPARGSVAAALARVEAGHLATSTWFVLGLGFWLVIIAMFGVLFVEENEPTWWGVASILPMMAHPLCGCVIVATHRAVTRGRRDGTEELFSSCPAGWSPRTRGHLYTMWVPVLATAVFGGVYLVLVATSNPFIGGPVDRRVLVDVVVGLLLPAGAAALGVALGRWAPWMLVPFAAVVLVLATDGQIVKIGGRAWASDRWLATFSTSTGPEIIFYDPPGWGRALWFVGLITVVAAIALLRGEHGRRVPALLGAGLVATLLGGWLVTQPLPEARAAERAALVNDPADHQTCIDVGEVARVCTFDALRDAGQAYADELEPVAAAVPPTELEPAVFRQLIDDDPTTLQPEVARLVEFRYHDTDHALRLRFYVQPDSFLAARLRLAAYVTGLPTEPLDDTHGTVVAGEARGIVVLWLASRGLSDAEVRHLLTVEPDDYANSEPQLRNHSGDIWPARCAGEGPVLLWSPQDLLAAARIIAADPDLVATELEAGWDRWTSPDATTDELLAALGLEPVGTPDEVDSYAEGCF